MWPKVIGSERIMLHISQSVSSALTHLWRFHRSSWSPSKEVAEKLLVSFLDLQWPWRLVRGHWSQYSSSGCQVYLEAGDSLLVAVIFNLISKLTPCRAYRYSVTIWCKRRREILPEPLCFCYRTGSDKWSWINSRTISVGRPFGPLQPVRRENDREKRSKRERRVKIFSMLRQMLILWFQKFKTFSYSVR